MSTKYDVIVIGSGPGGMTAALYASRANLKVAMLDRGLYGGQMNNTADIENYPGFNSILGPDLSEKMYQSSMQFGAEFLYGNVNRLYIDDLGIKHIVTDDDELLASAVIIATGSESRKLGVKGEDEYSGRGVSYCAVCDGSFYKNKPVAVIGGGDSAVEEGMYLANLTEKVNVVHRRDTLRAQKILQERAFSNSKMSFDWNSNVVEILGDEKKITGLRVQNNQTQSEKTIPVEGVFIYVGTNPMTAPFQDLDITNDKGWIKTNENMETSIPGIFAIGDVREKKLRQITTAVGDAGIAGQEAFSYIESLKDLDK